MALNLVQIIILLRHLKDHSCSASSSKTKGHQDTGLTQYLATEMLAEVSDVGRGVLMKGNAGNRPQ